MQLVVSAEHHIDMVGGGYGWWLEQNPTFTDQIRSKQAAGSGIQIRICQADPYGPLVQARRPRSSPKLAIHRFDDWLITSPYLTGQRGLLTYADVVHRSDVGTKFDQLVNGHFEPLWKTRSRTTQLSCRDCRARDEQPSA